MRKLIVVVGLVAALVSPLSKPVGAAEVVIPREECKTVFLPAQGGLRIDVEKRITLAGTVLDLAVHQDIVRVVKTIAVRVCIGGEGDIAVKADLTAGLNGVAACREGAAGLALNVPVTLVAGTRGGAVNVRVLVAISDRDTLLGEEFNNLDVVISEHKRVVVPPALIEDRDAVKADLCVGPAVIG